MGRGTNMQRLATIASMDVSNHADEVDMGDSTSSYLNHHPIMAAEAAPTAVVEQDDNKLQGQVFWIRHGESEGNEKNIFSGVVDFRLTRYGEMQGRRAAVDLHKKFGQYGGQFDAIYTSNLFRAIRTKELALQEDEEKIDSSRRSSMKKPTTVQKISTEISERSQGIFTGENKSLVMALLGVDLFVEFLESPSHCPLGGESGGEIYDRCKAFYDREVQPRLDRGENVLVVCHEFVIMGMVCYLSGGTRTDFVEFKVPNGKALSSKELMGMLEHETDPFHERLDHIGNWTIVNALRGGILLYIFGGLLRVVSQSETGIPSWLFRILIVGLNFGTSLYTYLDVDLGAVMKNVSGIAVVAVLAHVWTLRWTVALLAINYVDAQEGTAMEQKGKLLLQTWMLYLMVPPALTSPGIAKLTGGNMYECATLSPILSLVFPILLPSLARVGLLPETLIDTKSLGFHWAILAGGLWFPCLLSQFLRWKSPVEVAKHTKHWNFLTGWCLMGLGLLGGFQTCPINFFHFFQRNASADSQTGDNLPPLIWAVAIWTALRYSALFLTSILKSCTSLIERQLIDVFVLVTTPNFFLWLSIGDSTSGTSSLVNFWAGFLWFGGIAFEHRLCVIRLGRRLCRSAVGGTVMSAQKVNELIDRFDAKGNNTLDTEAFKELLKHFYRNSGEPIPHIQLLNLLVNKMMKHMGQDRDGNVPREAVKAYLMSNGMFVNLNSVSPAKAGFQRKNSRRQSRRATFFQAVSNSLGGGGRPRISGNSSRYSAGRMSDSESSSMNINNNNNNNMVRASSFNKHKARLWGSIAHGNPQSILESLKQDGILDEEEATLNLGDDDGEDPIAAEESKDD
jgi:bisphosphoglycerate-dependent phosphoglycerate mutase